MLSRETMLRKLHVRDEYYRRRARQSFAEFLRHTKPDYQLSWFHEELGLQSWTNFLVTSYRSAVRA